VAPTALVFVLLATSCARQDAADAASCEKMRDHVIDLRLADASHVDREAHRRALTHALGENFVSTCKSAMTGAQVRCVLGAADSKAADACVSSRSPK
jgi:hypothetical protein